MHGIFAIIQCCKNIKIKINRNKILPVFLCGCETWLFTLTEEHGRRVFNNRALMDIWA